MVEDRQAMQRRRLSELHAEEVRLTDRFLAIGIPTKEQCEAQRRAIAGIRARVSELLGELLYGEGGL